MKEQYAMEVSNGVVEIAQSTEMTADELIKQAKEICEKNKLAMKKEVAFQRFTEKVKGE